MKRKHIFIIIALIVVVSFFCLIGIGGCVSLGIYNAASHFEKIQCDYDGLTNYMKGSRWYCQKYKSFVVVSDIVKNGKCGCENLNDLTYGNFLCNPGFKFTLGNLTTLVYGNCLPQNRDKILYAKPDQQGFCQLLQEHFWERKPTYRFLFYYGMIGTILTITIGCIFYCFGACILHDN